MRKRTNDPIGRVPPHSIEAEMAVLGAMLLGDRCAVAEAVGILAETDFYRDAHATIFRAMVDLNQRNEPVDIITLQAELSKGGNLESIGIEYLLQLSDVEFTTSNLRYYAGIVSDNAKLRRIIEAASVIAGEAYDKPEDVETFASTAVTRLLQAGGSDRSAGGYRTLRQMMSSLFDRLDERWNEGGALPGMATGFCDLDRLTGGFKNGDLVIVAGRPAMGKTAFICNFLLSAAKRGERVLFASLEMTEEQVSLRMLSSESKVDSTRIEAGHYTEEERDRISEAAGRLARENLLTDDTGSLTVSSIIARAQREATSGPVAAVVVDYLQEAASEERAENRALEIARSARAFKALAKALNCVVIVLSQLSRAVEKRDDKHPTLSDLYESGGIEAAADIVLGLYRPAYYEKPNSDTQADEGVPEEAEIICLKNRKGAVGTVKLNYYPHWTRFDNLEYRTF